jgi:hypothetical protein
MFQFADKVYTSPGLSQIVDVKSLEHKHEVKKKTRSGDKKMRKVLKAAGKVRPRLLLIIL